MREHRIKPSERKFVAYRKFSKSGFEPKPLKKSSVTLNIKVTKSELEILGKFVSLIMANTPVAFIKGSALFSQIITAAAQSGINYYFLTTAGGKDVLTSKQPQTFVQEVLAICNTTKLNASEITPIMESILTLCDGSVIKALNDSLLLNITTDPALRCIDSQFNPQCIADQSDSMSIGEYAGYAFAIAIPILIICCCIAGIKKCCCDKPSSSERQRLMSGASSSSQESRQLELQKKQLREMKKVRSELEEVNNRAYWDNINDSIRRNGCIIS